MISILQFHIQTHVIFANRLPTFVCFDAEVPFLSISQSFAPFWHNAIHWLDEGRNGVVGVIPALSHHVQLLNNSGMKCELTGFKKDLSVFVCIAYSDDRAEEIQDFVAEGGGLLIGGHAWYWAQSNHGKNTMTDFSGKTVCYNMLCLCDTNDQVVV